MMLSILRAKFSGSEMADKLLRTGFDILIKGNTWGDALWSVCNGVGRNVFGETRMTVRTELRSPSSIL